ncbi:MAG: prohibitin family protein [Alphaproteobacteria bacterium]|nr:prohibitin family protein [Alphaproteobacteria bacterium]
MLGVLALIASGFAQIAAGRVGVSSLFGAVDSEPLTQGLHLINPLKSVTQMSIRTEAISVHAGPGGRPAGDTVDSISSDGMRMPLDVTVYYRLLPADAPWVYQNLGEDFADKIVVPATRTAVREALARFTAQEAYSTKRDQLALLMQDFLRRHVGALLDDYKFTGQAVVVQQVLLRNIGIPDQVRDAIEKKLAAEQQALAMQFVLQKETQEAERKRIEARGIADFQKIVTEGISDKLLAWKGIEATLEISKSPNAKVVVIGNSKNGLPLIFDSSGVSSAPR